MTTEPETTQVDKEDLRTKRLKEFESNISQHLQRCLTEASEVKAKANSAKTATKKRFYEKRFNKITKEAKQAIVALQQIKAVAGMTDDADGNT